MGKYVSSSDIDSDIDEALGRKPVASAAPKPIVIERTSVPDVSTFSAASDWEFIKPMLAEPHGEAYINNPNYAAELKYDGRRAVIQRIGNRTRIWGRSGSDWTRNFPEVIEDVPMLGGGDFIIDGELVTWTIGDDGFPIDAFNLSGRANMLNQGKIDADLKKNPHVFHAFDVLMYNGKKVMNESFIARKELLERMIPKSLKHIQYVHYVTEDKEAYYNELIKRGHEGIILKQVNAPYVPDSRGPYWKKIKGTDSEEVIVVGTTIGTGVRNATFGALILAQWEPTQNRLVYVGKVGTGFDNKMISEIYERLCKLKTVKAYFPVGETVNWYEAKLVAEVSFQERSVYGIFRFPVFKCIRDDKKPQDATTTQSGTSAKVSAKTYVPPTTISDQEKQKLLSQVKATSKKCKLCGNLAEVGDMCKSCHDKLLTAMAPSPSLPTPASLQKQVSTAVAAAAVTASRNKKAGEISAGDMSKYGW
jgi:bifunctional non-homologous end joining protein LigD